MSLAPPLPGPRRPGVFRFKLVCAMMGVVVGLAAAGSYFAERNAAADAESALQVGFRSELKALEATRETRSSALTLRCLALVRKARIHAALEDDALDLLYVSARDELKDLMAPTPAGMKGPAGEAIFYRFLDAHGIVIPAPGAVEFGELSPEEAASLALPGPPATDQLGFLARADHGRPESYVEIITTPIRSTATGRPIAALVVGFATDFAADASQPSGIRRGLWIQQHLHMASLDHEANALLTEILARRLARPDDEGSRTTVTISGGPQLLLSRRLNPESLYPAAFEVSLYSLQASLGRQRQLRLKIWGAGALLVLGGLIASYAVATRLSRPVEELAVESQLNAVKSNRAEVSLRSTQVELQRATRFSADASHQLKTPVSVLRAGLQELLARDDVTAPVRAEIETLLNVTQQFTGMIEELLLLSRMDAGRLAIDFGPVDLAYLVAAWVDDLSVTPNELGLEIVNELPPSLCIAGEKRYVSHILVNLLENACRYNRPNGVIKFTARIDEGLVRLTIGNTGRPIPAEAQPHIFERFHRAGVAGDIPGHGLGLNLALELAKLHGGDLRLRSSAEDWTEFEVTFRVAPAAAPKYAQ